MCSVRAKIEYSMIFVKTKVIAGTRVLLTCVLPAQQIGRKAWAHVGEQERTAW
jgi:hypothetical protein